MLLPWLPALNWGWGGVDPGSTHSCHSGALLAPELPVLATISHLVLNHWFWLWTDSLVAGMSPGKNTRMLSGHAEMGLGKPRHWWNWTWQLMLKQEEGILQVHRLEDTGQWECTLSAKWERRTSYNSYGEGWGTLWVLCINLNQRPGFSHLWTSHLCILTARWEVEEQTPTHCKRRSNLRPTYETECVHVHGVGWHASQGPNRAELMWSLSHLPSYLKNHVCQVKSPETWKMETSLPFIRMGGKMTYRMVSFTSVSGKIMEHGSWNRWSETANMTSSR